MWVILDNVIGDRWIHMMGPLSDAFGMSNDPLKLRCVTRCISWDTVASCAAHRPSARTSFEVGHPSRYRALRGTNRLQGAPEHDWGVALIANMTNN